MTAIAAEGSTYTLSEADLVEVQTILFRKRMRTKQLVVPVAILLGLAVVALFTSVGQDQLYPALAAALAFVLVFPPLMIRVVIPRQVRAMMRASAHLTLPWRIAIEPDGLRIENALGESRYVWSAFTRKVIGPTMLILPTSPQTFVPIPLRALRDGGLSVIDAHLREAGVGLG